MKKYVTTKGRTKDVPSVEMRMYEVYEGDYLVVATSDRNEAMRTVHQADDLTHPMTIVERTFEAKAQEAPVVLSRTDVRSGRDDIVRMAADHLKSRSVR